MAKSFSEQIVSETIDSILNGWRNLESADLSELYPNLSQTSVEDVVARAKAVIDFRQASGLTLPTTGKISEDITTPASREIFIELLVAMGVDKENTTELLTKDSTDLIPQIGDPTTYAARAQEQGESLSITTIRSKLAAISAITSDLETPETSKHILQEDIPELLDEDSRVRQGAEQAYNYLRRYLQLGS